MKIAITGATGQLGQLIVNRLKNILPCNTIVAVVRSLQKASILGVEVREANYDNPEALIRALTSVTSRLGFGV